jgi:hypothetical protein
MVSRALAAATATLTSSKNSRLVTGTSSLYLKAHGTLSGTLHSSSVPKDERLGGKELTP